MIEGKLTNLRALDMGDVDRYVDWLNDREVTRHLRARYQIPRLAEENYLRERGVKQMGFGHSGGNFAIETKDGTHIGSIGFHYVNPENRKATLGVVIGDKRYWSKGYGTDAMLTLLAFGFEEMNLHRIDLSVDEDNERAIACYRKCGFVEEGRLRQERYSRGGYRDQLWMGLLRDEFRQLHGHGGGKRDAGGGSAGQS
jgi:RimJ/RimL family protein N-acetyltransferase